jgi:Na+-translocating ferredoxin:NAD+ oxidoreductase subunit B
MTDEIYYKLAKLLDTLPNGFPSTESGVEIRLLKRIFRPDEAELFCDLKLKFETAEQISQRTGRPLEGLEKKLTTMWQRGQIFGVELGETKLFKMVPWVIGIYEFQLPNMDRELAEMCEEYMVVYGRQFFDKSPQLMQVIPIEREISAKQEALSYEKVSSIIETGQSFLVMDCICKKEHGLLDKPCKKPTEVCMAIAPIPGIFEKPRVGRAISKADAYGVLQKAEDAGLVHLTWNVESGHYFICNCCGCCCGVLKSINDLGIPASRVVNAHYYAEIDPDLCQACGVCADERCQIKAVEAREDAYQVIRDRCIGCGLCINTCPAEAIKLVRKQPEELVPPPKDEMAWFDERARARGVDISPFK